MKLYDSFGREMPPREWETDHETGYVGYFYDFNGELGCFVALRTERESGVCSYREGRYPMSKALYDAATAALQANKRLREFKIGMTVTVVNGIAYTREELIAGEVERLKKAIRKPRAGDRAPKRL